MLKTLPLHWSISLALLGVFFVIAAATLWLNREDLQDRIITAVVAIPGLALLAAFTVDVMVVLS